MPLSEKSISVMFEIQQSNGDFDSDVVSCEEAANAIYDTIAKGKIEELTTTEALNKANKRYSDLVALIRRQHCSQFDEDDKVSSVEDLIKHVYYELTREIGRRMRAEAK